MSLRTIIFALIIATTLGNSASTHTSACVWYQVSVGALITLAAIYVHCTDPDNIGVYMLGEPLGIAIAGHGLACLLNDDCRKAQQKSPYQKNIAPPTVKRIHYESAKKYARSVHHSNSW